MKQTLQLKLSQHLTLTPQLQQSIRLLQLSTVELNAEVERMLQENPLLEKIDGEEDGPAEVAVAGAVPTTATETRTESAEERPDRGEREQQYEAPERPDFDDYSSSDGDWGGGGNNDQDDEGFYPQ